MNTQNEKQLTRGCGVLMPVSSLPSAYGIGTIGRAAYDFVDLLVDLKFRYWQILPIGPTSFGNSPYQALSAFAGNNYYIDLDELVNEGLLDIDEVRDVDWGSDERDVDYSSIYQNRNGVLKKAFKRFDRELVEYRIFKSDNRYWLDDYALFRALKDKHNGAPWIEWSREFRERDELALNVAREELAEETEFYMFCQYTFNCQWQRLLTYANTRGLLIIGDLPLYVAHDSADVWAHREYFQLKADGKAKLVSAVPPDAFSSTGQIWGNPVYDWDGIAGNDFEWWKERVSIASRMFNVIRIDHFIGVVKYFAVNPNQTSSTSGRWYKGPGKKFIDIVIQSMGNAKIIIDDAGPKTVVPGVHKLVSKSGLPCCRIELLGLSAKNDSENLPHNFTDSNVVLYTTTHDTETLRGFIDSRSDEELAYVYDYLGVEDRSAGSKAGDDAASRLADEIIRSAYMSCADVVIVPVQDLLGLGNEARINAPATVYGNWQWRSGGDTLAPDRCEWIRKLAYTYRR